MATQFKDFSKEVKDLLNKNHSKIGSWSLESKLKGDGVKLNPKADNKGVNVDVEFKCPITGLADIKVNANGNGDIKPKATYKKGQSKYEVAYNGADVTTNYEFQDPTFAATVASKLAWGSLPLVGGASVVVADNTQLGVGFDFDALTSGLKNYTLSVRRADVFPVFGPSLTTVSYDALEGFSMQGQCKLSETVTIVDNVSSSAVQFGVRAKACSYFSVEATADILKKSLSVAVIKKMGSWTAALTASGTTGKQGLGLKLTCE
jgi:hypothetical protein